MSTLGRHGLFWRLLCEHLRAAQPVLKVFAAHIHAWKAYRQTCKTAARTSVEGPQTGSGTCCPLAWKADRQLAKQLQGQASKAHGQALARVAKHAGDGEGWQWARPFWRALLCLSRAAPPQSEPSPKPHHRPTLKPKGRPAQPR